jgi:hypothetical protein
MKNAVKCNYRGELKIKKDEKMSIEVSNIDPLGLVVGIIDEIGMEKRINQFRTYAKKPGFDSKSLFLIHKYLRETGFLSLPA